MPCAVCTAVWIAVTSAEVVIGLDSAVIRFSYVLKTLWLAFGLDASLLGTRTNTESPDTELGIEMSCATCTVGGWPLPTYCRAARADERSGGAVGAGEQCHARRIALVGGRQQLLVLLLDLGQDADALRIRQQRGIGGDGRLLALLQRGDHVAERR